MRNFIRTVLLVLTIPVFADIDLYAQPQVLRGQVAAVVSNLTAFGRVEGAKSIKLAIGLPLRNRVELTNLLEELYNPASSNFHRFISSAEFAQRFGPSEEDYEKLASFVTNHGLRVSGRHPNRTLLDVEGPAVDVEGALHVRFNRYVHPYDGREFYAADGDPSLDLDVPVLGISGLDNAELPRPRLQSVEPTIYGAMGSPNLGAGPGGSYMGNDFRAAYAPGVTLTGTGQSVGLLQFDGYAPSDISYYESVNGLPAVPLVNVLLDGFSGAPTGTGGEVEVSLDIEMAISMAPGLSQVIVYMAGPYGNWHDILNRMATDNVAKQLGCSWYEISGPADPVADQIWQQMAAQGQSFFNASGDADAYFGLIDFPGDTPYITQVGGTTLTTAGPGGAWVSETVWNRGNGIGSGGGISTQYQIPTWQAGVSMAANYGSTTMRNTPDLAMTAENVYVRANGIDHTVGGTSCAAPLWAGFAALINQQAANSGSSTIGFLNPALYSLAATTNYAAAFHDTTLGNNGSVTHFPAVAGYDLATGWGTPSGQSLLNALAPQILVSLPISATEGDGVLIAAGHVQLPVPAISDMQVSLASSDTNRLRIPSSITIATGHSNVDFDITIVDDAILNGTESGAISAAVPGFGSGSSTMLIYDNETAAISVTLPATASEGDPPVAASVGLSTVPGANIRVTLSSSDSNALTVPAFATIPSGHTSAEFQVNIVDNHIIDQDHIATVTAHVQNWTNGTASTTIHDNEGTNLVVRLPASAWENAGILTNAGNIQLGGTVTTNLTVTLISGNTSKLQVPAAVVIPAGQSNAPFNLSLVDNLIADGHQNGSVAASASKFADGSASILILDDESPTPPWGPQPSDMAVNVPANTDLKWKGGNDVDQMMNGGFETGDFTGWRKENSGFGDFVINNGTYDPPGPGIAGAPFAGGFSVESEQTGTGTHVLYQDVTIPPGANPVILTWTDKIRNYGTSFATNQYFHVEIRSTNDSLLQMAYTTKAGDTMLADWVSRSVDMSAFAGLTIRIAFVERDSQDYFNLHLDAVSLQVGVVNGVITNDVYFGINPNPGLAELQGSTTNSSWTLPLLAPLTTYYWQVVSRRVGVGTGPVWHFTTAGVDHFAWTPISSPKAVNGPIDVTITAQDSFNTTVTNYMGPAALSGTVQGATIGITPTNTGSFVDGTWSGNVAVLFHATNIQLRADDGRGHAGLSNPFDTVYSNQPPIIFAQPTNQTLYLGQMATFSAVADGTQPLSYQWLLNSNAISTASNATATNETLVLSNAQLSQSGGIYSLLVTNLFGSTNSSNAMLTVTLPPPCAPPAVGLVSWWAGESNAIDSFGANNGTLQGGVTFTGGEVGQAFSFDGTSESVIVPDSANLRLTNQLTIEAWIKPIVTNGDRAIVCKVGGGGGLNGYQFGMSGNILFGQFNSPGLPWYSAQVAVPIPIILGTWNHVAWTYDQAAMKLYFNGQPVATNVIGPQPIATSSSNLRISGTDAVNGYFNGLIDEPSVYNTALSASNILAIYNAGVSGKCPAAFPPTITMQPTNQSAIQGTTASFSVGVAGSAPLTYQWRFNNSNILASVNASASNATLILTNVQVTNAGTYSVFVTNSVGSTNSSNALLNVTIPLPCAPPAVGLVSWWAGESNAIDSFGPNNGTLQGGVTFTDGEVGQAFQLNGSTSFVDVPDADNLRISGNITIEAWIRPLTTNGDHGIVAKIGGTGGLNGYEFGLSKNILFGQFNSPGLPWYSSQVAVPIPILLGTWNHVAWTYDQSVMKLYWNGQLVTSTNIGAKVIATSSSDLLIGSTPVFYGAIDEPSVYNTALSASNILAIYNAGVSGKCPAAFPPTITMQPTNQSAIQGTAASFSVGVAGSAPLTYQWRFNNSNILALVNATASNATLILTNVQVTNAGTYSVFVTNSVGSTNSSNAVLTLLFPPSITAQPVGDLVGLGCGVTFSSGASGSGTLSYQWRKDGTNLNGQTGTNLTILHVQPTDFGDYTMIASNSYGATTSSVAKLKLDTAPVPGGTIVQRYPAGGIHISAATILTNASDLDGDTLAVVGVNATSIAGGSVTLSNGVVTYLPPTNYANADAFNYTLSDGHCGGTALGTVLIQVRTDLNPASQITMVPMRDGSVQVMFDGIPGYNYRVQATASLDNPDWQDVATLQADAFGSYIYVDRPATNGPMRYFRSVWP